MNAVTDRVPITWTSRNALGIAVAARIMVATTLTLTGALSWAGEPGTQPPPVRGEIVLARASHEWMSQQIEEPCILPNPKVPGRLIMFYSAVASSNRVVAAIGKAWADTRLAVPLASGRGQSRFRTCRTWLGLDHDPPRRGALHPGRGRLLHLLLRFLRHRSGPHRPRDLSRGCGRLLRT